MKTVKILSLTLVMSIFCAGMTFAQQQNQNQQQPKKAVHQKEQRVQQTKQTAEERAQKQVQMMKDSLNLTSDQVTKLQAVQTQFNKDKEQAGADKTSAKTDMKAKKDAYDAQVKTILTPDQYQKYQAQHSKKMKSGDAKQGKAMKKAVKENKNLTKDQK